MGHNIKTNYPAHKNPDPNCPWCLGEGVCDSGGFTPWDTPIDVRCSCTFKEEDGNTISKEA